LNDLSLLSKELAKGEEFTKKNQTFHKKQRLDASHDIDFNRFFLKGWSSFVTTQRDFLGPL